MRRGEAMVSFDVKALVPRVPVDKALQFLETYLHKEEAIADEIKICTAIAAACVKQNFLSWKDLPTNIRLEHGFQDLTFLG